MTVNSCHSYFLTSCTLTFFNSLRYWLPSLTPLCQTNNNFMLSKQVIFLSSYLTSQCHLTVDSFLFLEISSLLPSEKLLYTHTHSEQLVPSHLADLWLTDTFSDISRLPKLKQMFPVTLFNAFFHSVHHNYVLIMSLLFKACLISPTKIQTP